MGFKTAALFEIGNTANCNFYWKIKAINSEIVAISEVYEIKQDCGDGIDCIVKNAIFTSINDQTL